MAVRKTEPTRSIDDARAPVDALNSAAPKPATEQATRARRQQTRAQAHDTMIWALSLYLMRVGIALMASFEAIYFILNGYVSPPLTPVTAALHAAALGISVLVLAATTRKWFAHYWRLLCFASILAIYGLTLAICLLSGDTEPLFISVALSLVGAAALMPWPMRWQTGLTAAALGAMGVSALGAAPADSQAVYRWLGALVAVVLGHFILAMREWYQAELAGRLENLRQSHQDLTDALARSETIMAERELAERRLHEGEATLRKIFDAAPDDIAIVRVSDGATLEVNREFLKTGYTREEVLGVSARSLGRWADPQRRREIVRELRQHGTVRNFEADLRAKDGRLVPSLISATLVELDGVQCVIAMSRDITELKKIQHELTGAHEALSSEVRELEASQSLLRDEIAERALAQQRLAESEATLRKVYETSLDSIAINRASDGRFVAVNDEFVRTIGYSREELLASTGAQIKAFANRVRMREMLERLRTDGFVRNFEIEFRARDGRFIPHLFSGTVVNVAGEPCVIAIIRDISPLKQTEDELRAAQQKLSAQVRELEASERKLTNSEAKLRQVLEASGDAISVNRLSDGRYLDVNQGFCDVTGYTREDVLGRSAVEIGVWPYREQLREYMRRLRDGRLRNFECTFRMKDGHLAQYLVSASAITLDGEQCIVTASRDVSELKRYEGELLAAREALSAQVDALTEIQDRLRAEIAERKVAQHRLQESEQTLRKIFEASLDTITIKRLSDGRYVDVNKEFEIYGYSREEALGKTAEELGIWADPAQLAALSQRVKLEGQVRNSEILCRTREGKIIPSLISAVAVELGGEQCVVSMVRDISRLKDSERELIAAREAALAASEAKSQFLSVMSHEIRTPMNAILGMADLLWETTLSVEQRRYLDPIRSNGSSLLNLVNGILDLSKVESGRLSLERVDFDLIELAEGVMETLGVRAHEKGLELALRVSPAVSTALAGDPLRLRQILINLLGNAIKFTEHGEVTLTVEAVGAMQVGESVDSPPPHATATSADTGVARRQQVLRFVVRDTGIGIAADKLETIFSNFIQADSTITRRYGGSGLGLTIVKRLVELMNGEIKAESRPGEGSSFSFTLALDLQTGVAAAGPPAVARATRLAGKRVLVVDDSPASCAILAELLALVGAVATVAEDNTEAIIDVERARAAGRPYDAIVADYGTLAFGEAEMPQHVLGATATAGEAMVLMLTADDLNSQLGRLRERGLEESQRCRYLLKPVRRAEFWVTLAAACAGAADHLAYRNGAVTTAATGYAAARSAAVMIKKPLKILLAEDSPDNRLLIEAYLKNTPYRLEYAENGEVALNKFTTGHYDVVLMDIQMPVMDGYEAVAEIRRLEQDDHRRPTPIIALTASAHDEAVRRSLKMGCDAHVSKPVKRSTLLEAIRDAVEPAPQVGDGAVTASQEPIVVQLDQELSDLIPGFLARKREDASAILAAAEHGESEAIARLGHKMKGEGGSYGLDAITDIGRELEQAAQVADLDAARRLARFLMNFLDRLDIVYRAIED
jgi:two-component system sensor histidine kinase/response regulator